MTTIAYRDGVIAFYSRRCAGNLITDNNAKKMHVRNGVTFFLSGAVSDMPRLMSAYLGESYGKHIECSGFVFDGGKLYEVGVDDECGGLWKMELDLAKHRALGSGSQHALTAMDMGADAMKAVQMAMLRDSKTGGRIRIYRLPTK